MNLHQKFRHHITSKSYFRRLGLLDIGSFSVELASSVADWLGTTSLADWVPTDDLGWGVGECAQM
jgi:hypothetical protein